MQLIARDGVFQYTPYLTIENIVLVPGTRADVAIRCDATLAGEDVIVSSSVASSVISALVGSENRHIQDRVFTLRVAAAASDGNAHPTDFPTSEAPLPPYLDSLLEEATSVGSKLANGAIELGVTRDGGYAINGAPFPGFHAPEAERYVDEMCLDKVYEYQIGPPPPPGGDGGPGGGGGGGGPPGGPGGRPPPPGGDGNGGVPLPPDGGAAGPGGPATGSHPYHQHVEHFQIVDGEGDTTGETWRVGEWRDVAATPAPNGLTIRMKATDFVSDGMV